MADLLLARLADGSWQLCLADHDRDRAEHTENRAVET
jgi:hypothetical protein